MELFARSHILFYLTILIASLSGRAVAGDEACAECHAAIVRSYAATAMANSSGPITAGKFLESFQHSQFTNSAGDAEYNLIAKPDGLYFSVRQADVVDSRRLDYFIGSGAVGRSYVTRVGQFLFQAPVSYYAAGSEWQISPGYQRSNEVNLTRPVEPSCLNCHASSIQPVAGTRNGYAAEPFLDNGISCERCHGPGERHIQQMKTGNKPTASIVNPAKLEATRRDSVCAQCHLVGEVRIARANQMRPFQPGDLLSDHSVAFVWSSGPAALKVNGHFEGLAQSRCKQASGDKLWCGSCHDPHRQPAAAARAGNYREHCLTCHAMHGCTLPRQKRELAHDDCTVCHMPRSEVRDVQHATFTDHSIPRVTPKPAATEQRAELIAFGEQKAAGRDYGLAYAFVALRDNDRSLGGKAFELLKAADQETPSDAKVSSQLAQLYDRMGDEATACTLYARAADKEPDAIAAAINHGSCLAKAGRVRESIAIWREVLRRSPGEEGARLNLAVALYRTGDSAGAEVELREALRFNPTSGKARQLLKEIAAPAR